MVAYGFEEARGATHDTTSDPNSVDLSSKQEMILVIAASTVKATGHEQIFN